ncbi:hypothetical protein B7P43_G01028 [Cryptotermes secundus]|uniref:Uncharacterized protein n=1 Tax=Cryptotermes secundus TaxID=105785 RepID=A0A2J7PG31_9NEOP|nr:uncharacterized protein LOC111874179 isoform X2 [Cryptotermes secundus]PNF15288.1 hypothetical protein B7P43_G01028 [Cryptotermes secundus]
MASSAPKSKLCSYKQRRMGPAPFASFEDLSDDVESPEEKQPQARPLPGIREDVTLISPGSAGGGLQTPSTPRIDISRASSSSHHDSNNSRDSSPERELFEGSGERSGAKLGLGFKEEGAADLRSSTEELDFHEEHGTVTERETQRRRERRLARQQQQQQQASVFKYELEAQSEKERKDSACSDVALLSISGRTSRLSSIGSGGSGASHISGMSHLSVVSGQSITSSGRSPSPHKMLLETSFCGSKPIPTQSIDIESPPNKHETESLEKALLSRQVDPTIAIVGDVRVKEAVKKKKTIAEAKETPRVEHVQKKSEPEDRAMIDKETVRMEDVQKKRMTEERTLREKEPPRMAFRNEWQLRDRDEWGPHTKQKPVTLNLSEQGKKPITFSQLVQQQQHQPAEVTPSASPKLSRHVAHKKTDDSGSRTPSPSSTSRKSSFTNLFKRNESGVPSPESPTVVSSKRKSSGLSTILKEASEGLRERSRSRSKSRERVTSGMTVAPSDTKGKKDNKNKSVFSSLFKKRDRKKGTKDLEGDVVSPVDLSSPDQKLSIIEPIGNVEFTFNSDGNYQPSEYGMIRAGERQRLRLSQEHEDRVSREARVVLDGSATKDDHALRKDHAAKNDHFAVNDLSSREDRVAKVELASQNGRVAEVVITQGDRNGRADLANQNGRVVKVDCVARIDHVSTDDCLTKEDHHPQNESLLPSESVMLPTLYQDEVARGHTNSLTLANSQSQSMPSQEDSKVTALVEVPDSTSKTDHHSSESERDSEVEYLSTKKKKKKQQHQPEIEPEEEDHERKGLVVQQDSFEEELPYVPTTLPQERSVAVPMVPIKQRIAEVKTCPIDRPRSTTPINPSLLDDYVQTEDVREQAVEKMRICLPREDSVSGRAKSPRRITKTWFEFAEQGLQSPREYRKPSLSLSSERSTMSPSPPPPPLPPRAQPTPPLQTPPPKPTGWINFEEIPEKRRPPKRIQTIPSRGTLDLPSDCAKPVVAEKTVYSYVNPEECKCECHETAGQGARQQLAAPPPPPAPQCSHSGTIATNGQSDISHLDVDSTGDRHSYMSDSSFEYPSPYSLGDNADYSEGLKPMKPFGMDLDITSNRSSIISQDEPQSPELGSPNGNES